MPCYINNDQYNFTKKKKKNSAYNMIVKLRLQYSDIQNNNDFLICNITDCYFAEYNKMTVIRIV